MQSKDGAAYPARYIALDAWRGIASFLVVLHHLYSRRSTVTEYFYLFVQLFFVISGYCLAAATDRATETRMTAGTFMRRRLRRIGPPYLASVVFALACDFLRGVDLGGWARAVRDVTYPWWIYLQNFTMTQWVTMTVRYHEHAKNVLPWNTGVCFDPPHWSLNYEEQFYLLMGCAVLVATYVRPAVMLFIVTAMVALAGGKLREGFTGLFCDYWLQFATGMVLYYRLCMAPSLRARRILDVTIAVLFAAVVYVAQRDGELRFDSNLRQYYGQLAVCMGFAILLLVMRRFDHAIVHNFVGKLFCRFGAISYSLYLVHYPFIKLTGRWKERIVRATSERTGDLIVIAAILVVAYLFYLAFEKPFLSRNRREQIAEAKAA